MSTVPSVQVRQLEEQRLNKEYLSCRDTYGDIMSKSKSKGIMRVIFQNINGLGTKEESNKREYLREFINKYKVDVMAHYLPVLVLL